MTASILAAHDGVKQDNNHDDVDRTLDATRNSNSFDDGAYAEPFPETVMDEKFARAEESRKGLQPDEESKDDLERSGMPVSSEQESLMNRSTLIVEEHDKVAKSEAKQIKILESMKREKQSLPHSGYQGAVGDSQYQYEEGQPGQEDSTVLRQEGNGTGFVARSAPAVRKEARNDPSQSNYNDSRALDDAG